MNDSTIVPDGIRSAPWLHGGRDERGIDCLGIVLYVSARLGNPAPDPWREFVGLWRELGYVPELGSGFPPTWQRIEYDDGANPPTWLADMRQNDVWVWTVGEHPGCGIVAAGRIWTAEPNIGVVCLDPQRAQKPEQVWRPA